MASKRTTTKYVYHLYKWDGHYIKGTLVKPYRRLLNARKAAKQLPGYCELDKDGDSVYVLDHNQMPIGIITKEEVDVI